MDQFWRNFQNIRIIKFPTRVYTLSLCFRLKHKSYYDGHVSRQKKRECEQPYNGSISYSIALKRSSCLAYIINYQIITTYTQFFLRKYVKNANF